MKGIKIESYNLRFRKGERIFFKKHVMCGEAWNKIQIQIYEKQFLFHFTWNGLHIVNYWNIIGKLFEISYKNQTTSLSYFKGSWRLFDDNFSQKKCWLSANNNKSQNFVDLNGCILWVIKILLNKQPSQFLTNIMTNKFV